MHESKSTVSLELEVKIRFQPNAEAFILDNNKREVTIWLGNTNITKVLKKEEIEEIIDGNYSDHENCFELELETSGTWSAGCRATLEDPGCPDSWDDMCATFRGIEVYHELDSSDQDSLIENLEYNATFGKDD